MPTQAEQAKSDCEPGLAGSVTVGTVHVPHTLCQLPGNSPPAQVLAFQTLTGSGFGARGQGNGSNTGWMNSPNGRLTACFQARHASGFLSGLGRCGRPYFLSRALLAVDGSKPAGGGPKVKTPFRLVRSAVSGIGRSNRSLSSTMVAVLSAGAA